MLHAQDQVFSPGELSEPRVLLWRATRAVDSWKIAIDRKACSWLLRYHFWYCNVCRIPIRGVRRGGLPSLGPTRCRPGVSVPSPKCPNFLKTGFSEPDPRVDRKGPRYIANKPIRELGSSISCAPGSTAAVPSSRSRASTLLADVPGVGCWPWERG